MEPEVREGAQSPCSPHVIVVGSWEEEVRAPRILPGRVDVISKTWRRLAKTARRTGMEPSPLLPLGGQALVLPIPPDGELKGYPRM